MRAHEKNDILAPRKVRVFISSTFQDMQEERDALHRVVFPYLRDACGQLQIEFVGVDLRWGITEEDAQQGKTIDICLAETEACYPFFLGILGERYGWVPPRNVRGRHEALFRDDISVTEAEIAVGALRHGPRQAKALFCLRDKSLSKQLQPGRQQKAPKKLTDLKARILASGFRTLDGYRSIEAFCDFVKTELEAMIASAFPPPEDTDAFSHEQRTQAFYARSLSADFIGRRGIHASLDAYAAQGGAPLLLTGKSGTGKSALLAHWVLSYQANHPQDFVFMHFCKASAQAADWSLLVRRLLHALMRHSQMDWEIPDEPGALLYALPKFLSVAQTGNILIAIDEAEILDAEDGVGLTWLPAELPGNVRLIVTAKDQAMRLLRSRGYREVQVPVLSRDEQLTFIDTYLPNLGKRFSAVQKQIAASYSITKTPIYLKTLLQELSIIGKYDLLTEQLVAYLAAPSTAALFVKVLERFERDYNTPACPTLVRDVFSLLYGSQQGMRESRLLAITRIPQLVWIPLYHAMQPYLLNQDGVLKLAQHNLRVAVQTRYSLHAPTIRALRATIAAALCDEPETSANTLELAWIYYTSKSAARLRHLLCDPRRITAFATDLNTLKRYWAFVESRTRAHSDACYAAIGDGADFPQLYVIVKFLLETGKYKTARALLNAFLQRPAEQDNTAALEILYGLSGKIEHKLGFYQAAKAAYLSQLALCEQSDHRLELARTYGNLGNLEAESGFYGKALDMYGEAIEIFEAIGHVDGVQNALGNCASIYTQNARYEEALALSRKRERLCRESRNDAGLIAALGNLSGLYLALGNHAAAQACLGEQEKLCKKIGDREQYQEISGRRAILFAEQDDYDDAERFFAQKLALSESMDYYDGTQLALYNLAQLYLLSRDSQKAIGMAQARKALCYDHFVGHDYADASLHLAQIYLHSGHTAEAIAELNKLEIFARMHDYHGIRRTAENLLLQARKVDKNG